MKSQMYVQADWKDINGLFNEIQTALENFGLFIYEDPEYIMDSDFVFMISNEKLTPAQVAKLCRDDEDVT